MKYAVLASHIHRNQFNEPLPSAAAEFDPFECCASNEPLPATLWPPAVTAWSVLPIRPADEPGFACGVGTSCAPLAGADLDGVAAAVAGADFATLVIAVALVIAEAPTPDASLVAAASALALTSLPD